VHPFHAYLCEHLDGLLRKRSVIVFYDPRNEFGPFFDRELEVQRGDPLPRVSIGSRTALLARYERSFFALRAAVEPIVAADKPEPLILYLPGVTRDRTGSVLMELEKAGTCYEPQLKRVGAERAAPMLHGRADRRDAAAGLGDLRGHRRLPR
jgi:hypothetical protein